MNIIDRIDEMLTKKVRVNEEIDWDKVKEAGEAMAKKIHDNPDKEIINNMIDKIKKDKDIKDTEDAIGMMVGMLRG